MRPCDDDKNRNSSNVDKNMPQQAAACHKQETSTEDKKQKTARIHQQCDADWITSSCANAKAQRDKQEHGN